MLVTIRNQAIEYLSESVDVTFTVLFRLNTGHDAIHKLRYRKLFLPIHVVSSNLG